MATIIQNGRQGWLGHACNDKETDAPPVIAPMLDQKKPEKKQEKKKLKERKFT